uniref:Uncharacterized protein n=1 Tax=Zea mays TaxID=4577 RepID=A0A804PUK5_MAIZE
MTKSPTEQVYETERTTRSPAEQIREAEQTTKSPTEQVYEATTKSSVRMVGFGKLPKYHHDTTAEELAKTLDCWPSMNYYITGCRYVLMP